MQVEQVDRDAAVNAVAKWYNVEGNPRYNFAKAMNGALAGQAVIRERERIIDVIDAHIRFHCEVVESANKAGATMATISGGISALSMLKRDLL